MPPRSAALKQALEAFREQAPGTVQDVRWPGIARRIAPDLFDRTTPGATLPLAAFSWPETEERSACSRSRSTTWRLLRIFEGDLEAAAALVDEADAITDVTGEGRIPFGRLTLAGFRGDEAAVSKQIEVGEAAAIDRGEGVMLTVGEHARALLYNGLGRYDAALTDGRERKRAAIELVPLDIGRCPSSSRRPHARTGPISRLWRSSVSPSERRRQVPNGRSASKRARAPS